MANILFFVVHQTGALNATWKLAHDLRDAGHCVSYAGLVDSREAVTKAGFGYTSLFQDFFPPGYVATLDHSAHSRFQWLRSLFETPRQYFVFKSFLDYLVVGGDRQFLELLDASAIDFVVYVGVPYVEWMAILAMSRGVGGVYLRADFSTVKGTGSPPADSGLIPRLENSFFRSLGIKLAWMRTSLHEGFAFLGSAKLTARFAAHYGLCGQSIPTTYAQLVSTPLPELVPFHPAFEFSSFDIPGRYYIGASLDLRRPQIPFDRERLSDDRPLVYCSLGTYLWRTKSAYRRFFRALLEAAAAMPERQFVIATGATVSPADLPEPSANVVLVETAPQLELLERASVAVTHAGANSVKECIWLGVPMVVLPLGGDQPGVAARAAHHGLAIRGAFDSVTARELQAMILTAEGSPYIRAQLRLMRQRFLDLEQEQRGLRIIETLLPASARTERGPSRGRETAASAL